MLAGGRVGDLSRAANLDRKWVQVDDIEKQMVLAISALTADRHGSFDHPF